MSGNECRGFLAEPRREHPETFLVVAVESLLSGQSGLLKLFTLPLP